MRGAPSRLYQSKCRAAEVTSSHSLLDNPDERAVAGVQLRDRIAIEYPELRTTRNNARCFMKVVRLRFDDPNERAIARVEFCD